jgi:hypothetical protein
MEGSLGDFGGDYDDIYEDYSERKGPNHEIYVSLFGDPGGKHYSRHFFEYMYDGGNSPIYLAICAFPWAVVSYLGAISVKVLSHLSQAEASLYTQIICPVLLFLFAIPLLILSRKMAKIILA